MLTTISFNTKRGLNPYDNPSRWTSNPNEYSYHKKISITSASETLSKTSSSTSVLLSLLREIQTKREVKTFSPESSESVFDFVNKKSKLYEWKYKVYNLFNKPDNFWAISYHMLVFCLVFTCFIFTVFSTISRFAKQTTKVLFILEKIIIFWFLNEFCLRLWSSSCKLRYYGWKGKLKYMRCPSHILDLSVILISAVVVIADTRKGSEVFVVSAFRGFHRLFRVFQMLTLNRQIQPWKLLIAVIRDQMHQLLIIVYIEFISIFILAYISYILEKDAQNNQLTSLAEALWWAVITLSTVGYGDRVHVTWWGKLISSLFTLLGVALFALPAGIIGAGLAIRIEKEESNRLKKNKKMAAIVLIQSMWRCHKTRFEPEFDTKSNHIRIENDLSEKIVLKFLSLTKFFAAKTKFKRSRDVLDLENTLNGYKLIRLTVDSRVREINDFVRIMKRSVTDNELQISSHEKHITNRIEKLNSMIDTIESEINRQNLLIDFIAFNSISNGNQLKSLSNKNVFKPRHQNFREQPFNGGLNCNFNTNIKVN